MGLLEEARLSRLRGHKAQAQQGSVKTAFGRARTVSGEFLNATDRADLFDEGPAQARLDAGVTGLVIDYGNCT